MFWSWSRQRAGLLRVGRWFWKSTILLWHDCWCSWVVSCFVKSEACNLQNSHEFTFKQLRTIHLCISVKMSCLKV
jgi:hypothetical protein